MYSREEMILFGEYVRSYNKSIPTARTMTMLDDWIKENLK
jgi:hypothetical protein